LDTLDAAQQSSHPGDQLPHAERLCQIVVGAHLQANHAVRLLTVRGQHQDGDGGHATDLPQDLRPVQPRQYPIEDHQVRLVLGVDLERLHTVAGDQHLVIENLKLSMHDLGQIMAILDQQNRRHSP
jgi:hypothetical protein